MADQSFPSTDSIDLKTRANLAYILIVGGLIMIGYILYRWGDHTEILTLIIGLIGGSLLGSPISVFFGGSTSTKKTDPPVVTTNAETTNVSVNNPPPATP